MKLSVKLLLIYTLVTFGLTALAIVWGRNEVENSISTILETKDDIQLKEFSNEGLTGFDIGGPFDIVLHNGPGQSSMSGPALLMKDFDLEIENGILEISSRRLIIPKGIRIKLDIYEANRIDRMEVYGSADISSPDTLDLNRLLSIKASESNTVKLNHRPVGNIKVNVGGTSNIQLIGTAEDLNVGAYEAGNADLEGLIANTAMVRTAGSCEVRVHVKTSLDVNVGGVSNVYYVDTGVKITSEIASEATLKTLKQKAESEVSESADE